MMSLSGTTVSCAAVGARPTGNNIVSDQSGSGLSGGPSSGGFSPFARALATAPLGSLTVRKWRLENGLEIITVPDPGARSVSYLTVYRVGSRDENAAAGETGLAHLFEHLMFTGTERGKTGGNFDEQIEGMGGSSNAQTYYDFTSYIDEVPPDGLDRAIRLEAERMVNLDLAAKQVTNERDVVIEERLGTVEDSVDGMLDEMVWQQAFHAHPYRWPIIGLMADIKA
ncbi:MAG: pitrilysin family protein, partial [Polyangia bacterium]